MTKRFQWIGLGIVFFIFLAVLVTVRTIQPEFSIVPKVDKTENQYLSLEEMVAQSGEPQAGRPLTFLSHEQTDQQALGELTPETLDLGKRTFYQETFGNEVFFTDIMGILDGPLSLPLIAREIAKLKGQGTDDLTITLPETVTVGGKTLKKGTVIHTGLDVPKGSLMPLGMVVKASPDGLKIGMSCAGCHAAVNPTTGRVIEGAPNSNLNVGLLMALASNSQAYFRQTDVSPNSPGVKRGKRVVTTEEGKQVTLPDPRSFEEAVDRVFMSWPAGNFDSTIDLKANPSQIPDSFTLNDFPYGWSGFAIAGPFHGLAAFSSNVHATNADPLTTTTAARQLFNLDKEVYIGSILQNAANPRYRLPDGEQPSAFFQKVDPTPDTPGVVEAVKAPTFPRGSLVAPDGLILSSPGFRVGQQINAVAAWQNTLLPPKSGIENRSAGELAEGRRIFAAAGCGSCHSGSALTNHQVIPVEEVKTQPSRAKALQKLPATFARQPSMWRSDMPTPLPADPVPVPVPTADISPRLIALAYAQGNNGGYKVPGLIGLKETAPYLHDGGVAAGKDAFQVGKDGRVTIANSAQLGLPGTVMKHVSPDPANSLRAFLDRRLRRAVVDANRKDASLRRVNNTGEGHPFWVDTASGFTDQDREALVKYLLSLSRPQE